MQIKNLYRCIAAIIAVVIQISVCANAAVSSSDLNVSSDIDTAVNQKIGFLHSLGIINDATDTADEAVLNDNITRGEFSLWIAQANNFDLNAYADNRYFLDVEKESDIFKSVNALMENGIISSADDGRFRPNDKITNNEVCVMLVNSLGYKSLASVYGGYTTGYLRVAKQIGLGDIFGDEEPTYAQAIDDLYRALLCTVYEIESISTEETKYGTDDSTWLYNSFKLADGEGIVEAVYGAALYSDAVTDEGYMRISGKQYKCLNDFENLDLIGDYVRFFFREDTNEVVGAIKEYAGKDDTAFELSLLDDFANNEIEFYKSEDSSKKISYKLSENYIVVYNGMPLTSDVDKIIDGVKDNDGYIKIKDSNVDGRYDTVIIESYKPFLVNSYDTRNDVLYNRIKAYDYLDISDDKFVSVRNTEGNTLKKTDIKSKMLLNVAKSIDGSMIRIIVCNDKITGKFSYTSDDTVTINGEKYFMGDYFKENLKNQIGFDKEYTVYIDSFNKVVFADADDARNMKYGYLVRTSVENGFGKEIKFMIFTEDNEMNVYAASEKLKVDNVSFVNYSADAVKDYFNGVTVIEFTTDADGEINYIDTAKVKNDSEDSNYSLRPVFNAANTKQWYNNGRFGLSSVFGDKTVTFYVPSNNSVDIKDYSVGAYSNHFSTSNCIESAEVYYRSDNSAFIDIMVSTIDVEAAVETKAMVLMVDETGETIDENGDVVFYISGYNYEAKYITQIFETENCYKSDGIKVKLKRGDLVVINRNRGDEGIGAEVVYSANDMGVPSGFNDNGQGQLLYAQGTTIGENKAYRAETQLSFGYVKRKFADGVITWSTTLDSSEAERANIGTSKVVTYDVESEKILIGDISEILEYNQVGKECSRIFMMTHLGVTNGAFIYN